MRNRSKPISSATARRMRMRAPNRRRRAPAAPGAVTAMPPWGAMDESRRFCRLFRQWQNHADRATDPGAAAAGTARVGGQACAPPFRHRPPGQRHLPPPRGRRLALMREVEQATTLSVHQLLAELCQDVDWVLVEGFKGSDLPKIEVWRPPHPGETGAPGRKPEPVRYPGDDCVVAVATNAAHSLPVPTTLPVLDLDAPDQGAGWLIRQGQRFGYERPLHGGRLRCAPQ